MAGIVHGRVIAVGRGRARRRRCSAGVRGVVRAEQQSYEVGDRPHDVEVLIKDPLQLEAVEHGLEKSGGALGADALAKPAAGRLVGESVDELALSLMMIPPRACVGMTTWVRFFGGATTENSVPQAQQAREA
ncbi:hypothetical protein [Streptomyces griseorubiginosus]|uniref:hypothetical protein n=1 Tax=Streptomyces griseorubiginosus TaxID=67304 RepID=UPI0036611AA2